MDPLEIQSSPYQLESCTLFESKTRYRFKPNIHYLVQSDTTTQKHAWFDVRVFYVRLKVCLLNQAPESLLICYPPREMGTVLEVNGGRISPSEKASFTLRRDRVDAESVEATFVSTNNLRTTGKISFEIYDRAELLVVGRLFKSETDSSGQDLLDGYSSFGTSPMSNKVGWIIDCQCAIITAASSSPSGRTDISKSSPSSMEVYVAGRSSSIPIVLTQTVQLGTRRRSMHYSSLDAIPEGEEPQCNQILAGQISEDSACANLEDRYCPGIPNNIYSTGGDLDEGEGELSWFNAGVRVGLGIGLGICLGIGLGVGLLMRTYQTTAGPFRRRPL